MPEPRDGAPRIYALMAEFTEPDALVAAARQAREEGFERFDAFSPFPVDGLPEAMGFNDRRVQLIALAGAVGAGVCMYALLVFINLDYPLNVGGRPLIAHTAFALIAAYAAILGAAVAGVVGMLALNRLPRLHHPLFDDDRFALASSDRFFLVVFRDDPRFDPQRTRAFLEELGPRHVDVVPDRGPGS